MTDCRKTSSLIRNGAANPLASGSNNLYQAEVEVDCSGSENSESLQVCTKGHAQEQTQKAASSLMIANDLARIEKDGSLAFVMNCFTAALEVTVAIMNWRMWPIIRNSDAGCE